MREIIEKVSLNGAVYQALAEVLLDGRPILDEVNAKRRPDPYDPRPTTKYEEAFAAATVACLSGLTRVEISSETKSGEPREAPDLLLSSQQYGMVGVEVRRVDETAKARERLIDAQKAIAEFLEANPERKVNVRFTLDYEKTGVLASADGAILAQEIIEWFRSGRIAMLPDGRHETVFPEGSIAVRCGIVVEVNRPSYAVLLGFAKADEMAPFPGLLEAIESKRKLKYTCDHPLWLVVVASDPHGPFTKAVEAVRKANPPIDPFERVFVFDGTETVIRLESVGSQHP